MILVQLHNKPQGLYSRFFAFLPLFYKNKTDKCRRKRFLRNYNGPKVAKSG